MNIEWEDNHMFLLSALGTGNVRLEQLSGGRFYGNRLYLRAFNSKASPHWNGITLVWVKSDMPLDEVTLDTLRTMAIIKYGLNVLNGDAAPPSVQQTKE